MLQKGNFLALFLLLATAGSAQTLFTYGKYPVSTREFVHAFDKNPPAGDRRQAMEEYLPLYINYKLKVRYAYDARMDTLPGQRIELENYSRQLQDGFLNERSAAGKLVEEALERSRRDIRLGHLFVGFNPGDTVAEKRAAQTAAKAWQQLKEGKPFDATVREFSTDPDLKANGGQVGWVTVFSLPYVYENAVYGLARNGFSEPLRGSDGYHIFKHLDERFALGKVKVAQILLWTATTSTPAERAAKKRLADSLYLALKAGADFNALALQYSNDRSSYASGGQLPEFGIGQYDAVFEQKAFSLRTPDELTEPFETPYGYHILRLVKRSPPSLLEPEPETYQALQAAVFNDKRMEIKQQAYLKSLLPKMKYVPSKYPEAALWRYTDSAMQGKPTTGVPGITPATLLFSLGSQKSTVAQWISYLRVATTGSSQAVRDYPPMMDRFLVQQANGYYRDHLAQFEPDFKAQLAEFKDANLLFEAMESQVWAKASADEAGLKKYFEAHSAQYKWGAGARALVVTAMDSAAAWEMHARMQQQPAAWRAVVDKYPERLMADSARFETVQLPLPDLTVPTQGLLTTPRLNPADQTYTFTYVFEILPGGDPRSFEDARGFVINDYQAVLEKQWLDGLKKKYPVKVNTPEWQKLLAQAAAKVN